jgi:hypothetical protein
VSIITLVFIAGAIAVDLGYWFSERRGVARASDMAAAAAAQDLPADPAFAGGSPYQEASQCDTEACEAAFTWAERNNYGEPDSDVRVYFYCGNTIPVPKDGVCFNEAQGGPIGITFCPNEAGEVGCDTVKVEIEVDAVSLFSTIVGGVDFGIGYSSWGSAFFKVKLLDTVMAVDASGSMGGGSCNATLDNPGCPIHEARVGADNFITILYGDDPQGGDVQVGYTPYRGCYEPPSPAGNNCIPSLDFGECGGPPPTSLVVCLNKDPEELRDAFNATQPAASTNVCLGLYMAADVLLNSPTATDPNDPDLQRFIVLLTDGDNSFQNISGIPNSCRPESGGCGSGPGGSSRRLDDCTLDLANAIIGDRADPDVEIYVIGLNVSGNNNENCNAVGSSDNNRRLLKCVASSTPGTNDHYFETNNAIGLGNIFRDLAYEIGGRGLSEGL